jgi:outer membrane murein-binding lipoprotein Lpp
MKTLVINFLVSLVVLAMAILGGCQSSAEKVDSAKENVEEAKEELQEVKAEAQADAIKVANAEEWRVFKSDAEVKIKENEIRIGELKIKMKKSGKTFDEMYEKNIIALEQKNKDLRTKISNYESNQSDWEAFKREFNHDMDELGLAIKDLTVNNKN